MRERDSITCRLDAQRPVNRREGLLIHGLQGRQHGLLFNRDVRIELITMHIFHQLGGDDLGALST